MTSVFRHDSHPTLHVGMQVEVVRGPLQGVHGILSRKEIRHRLLDVDEGSDICKVEWANVSSNRFSWTLTIDPRFEDFRKEYQGYRHSMELASSGDF